MTEGSIDSTVLGISEGSGWKVFFREGDQLGQLKGKFIPGVAITWQSVWNIQDSEPAWETRKGFAYTISLLSFQCNPHYKIILKANSGSGTRKSAGSRKSVKRIQKWPLKRVHPRNKANEASPQVVVEEVGSENSEEALSFEKVDSRANINIPSEDPQIELAGTRGDIIPSMSKVASGVKTEKWTYNIQYPSSDEEEDSAGASARLTCTLSSGFSVTSYSIRWYQQKPGSPPRYLLSCYSDSRKMLHRQLPWPLQTCLRVLEDRFLGENPWSQYPSDYYFKSVEIRQETKISPDNSPGMPLRASPVTSPSLGRRDPVLSTAGPTAGTALATRRDHI
ncbi:uncharacterized protein LOC123625964 [Lemur catta]|uniref:uncharacterized protein LOC123625964 n=1 Tax=Lemur catta TaxID=9447 RepID=UPI001E26A85C|nr:uncharacterized protein LOC123625964 [Lemur catta]